MPAKTRSNSKPTHAQIAARAYELWQQAGCPTDQAETHWQQASAELMNQNGTKAAGTPKRAPARKRRATAS